MELHLTEMHSTQERRPLWYVLNPFHGELQLRERTLEEIVKKITDPDRLIRWHGLRRTLDFYDEQVLPALDRLPTDSAVWRARYEAANHALQMHTATGNAHRFLRLIARLVVNLARARFAEDDKSNRDARHQARTFLRRRLARALDSLFARRHDEEARQAYELCQQLGEMTREHRAAYAVLLWRVGDRSPAATRVYLRHLSERGWNSNDNHHTDGMREFVEAQLAIDEQVPRQELNERLLYNQLALCSASPPPLSARHTGLGYLRLEQPERALDYLRRPLPLNGTDGGITAFYLGQALFQIKDYTQAAAAFEQATAQGYSPARIASWQGVAYAKNRQWDKAVQTFRLAEEGLSGALDSEFYVQWGRASFLMKDAAEAERRFQQAVEQDSTNWRAAYGLAICLEQQGRRDAGLETLRAITERGECAAPVYHLLGRLLEATGEEEKKAEAVSCFRQAVALCPNDPEYRLSLGLALDDLGDPEGLPMLEQLAKEQAGGPEVLRRVVVGYFQRGERARARRWLRALAADDRTRTATALFNARDRASEATEAFNAGRLPEAIALWEQVALVSPEDSAVQERLAQALAHDAARRITSGEQGDIWKQIDRAQALAPSPESRFLSGFACLVRNDFHTAQSYFAALAAEFPERHEYSFFENLAAYFAGDEDALSKLAELGPVAGAANLNSLLAFLQIQLLALKADFEQAAEKLKAWAAEPEAVRNLGLPAHQINALAALCLTRGTRQKKQRVVSFFKDSNTAYGDGYWDFALTLAKQYLATSGGVARAATAEAAKLDECAAAYQDLLSRATPAERQVIVTHYARLLRFMIGQRVGASNIGGALEAIEQLVALPLAVSPEVQGLRDLLAERLAQPSHEKAYALLDNDPHGAREVWEAMLRRNAQDFAALQHLACLAWSRAYDEVAAARYDQSLPFWGEGLEWYRQLYEQSGYWEQLRAKGRLLGQMPGASFNEQAFDEWCNEALYQMARTLLDLITNVLAGYDPTRHSGKMETQVKVARSLMKVIRESKLPKQAEKSA